MSDPRNVAHDKKVKQEKAHEKPEDEKPEADAAEAKAEPAASVTEKDDEGPSEHERSVAVLSKLKELEFHSRANVETLAGLMLTIEDELKQKDFVEPIGDLYGAQDAFQTKVAALVESYETKCDSLKSA